RPAPSPASAARLVHLAPALLGSTHPDHLLRAVRAGGGPGAGSPRGAAADRGFSAGRHRGEPAGPPSGVVLREVPAMRRPSAARDRRLGHVPRLRLVLPTLSVARAGRPPV